jgi:hypothetical protein
MFDMWTCNGVITPIFGGPIEVVASPIKDEFIGANCDKLLRRPPFVISSWVYQLSIRVTLEIVPPTPSVWLPIVGPFTGTFKCGICQQSEHVNVKVGSNFRIY